MADLVFGQTSTPEEYMGLSATRKVVINKCFGGFSLSPRAVERIAELQGRPCFFYINIKTPDGSTDFRNCQRVSRAVAETAFIWFAFDIPDADTRLFSEERDSRFRDGTQEERQALNAEWERHEIDNRDVVRDDPLVVQVVEELEDAANGRHAELRIVEIPADVKWGIHEYDGLEHVEEEHRTWG